MSVGMSEGRLRNAWQRITGGRRAESLPTTTTEAVGTVHEAASAPLVGGETVEDDRGRILRILEEGRISVAEADELLRLVGEPPLASPAPEPAGVAEDLSAEPKDEEVRTSLPAPSVPPAASQAGSQEAWKAFEEQLKALGKTVGDVVRAGFSSASWKDFEGSLNRLGEDLSSAVDRAVESGQVDQLRQQTERLAQLAGTAVERTMEEVQPQIDAALRQAGDELQRIVQRLEYKQAGAAGASEPADEAAAEERKRILRLVEERRIGAEEADALLAALDQKRAPQWSRGARPGGGGRRRVSVGGLAGASLRGARLQGAKIGGAGFEGALMEDANLEGADLTGADFTGAVLHEANLQGADLRQADLTGAVMSRVNLQGSNLENTDLSGAMIEEGADLRGLDLSNLDLSGAQLTEESVRQVLQAQKDE